MDEEQGTQRVTFEDYIGQNHASASSFGSLVDGFTALPPVSRQRLPDGTGEFRRAEDLYHQLKRGESPTHRLDDTEEGGYIFVCSRKLPNRGVNTEADYFQAKSGAGRIKVYEEGQPKPVFDTTDFTLNPNLPESDLVEKLNESLAAMADLAGKE